MCESVTSWSVMDANIQVKIYTSLYNTGKRSTEFRSVSDVMELFPVNDLLTCMVLVPQNGI